MFVTAATDNVEHVERVRCLDCGTRYARRAGPSSVSRNPGCPRCGYVGWIHASIPRSPYESLRSGADRLPSQTARPR